MRFFRLPFSLFLLLVLCSAFLFLVIGTSQSPSHASWREWSFTPSSDQCSLVNNGEINFFFDIQADGSWHGVQRTSQTNFFQKQDREYSGKSITDLRDILLESPCGIGNLPGIITLELRGRIQAGQAFNLVLPSNPSTGYLWEVEEIEGDTAITSGNAQMHQITPRIGGMAAQIISFRGLRFTEAAIRLRYHRPWEADATTDIAYKVQGNRIPLADLAQNISLTIPDANLDSPKSVQTFPFANTPSPSQIDALQQLPTKFDWCDLGKCTSVRDQGQCGSCWAFATVGVFESKLLIADNNSQNLSEQYLVSCNTDGWGCDGGWFAHDYHIWKTPPSETEAGAVLESSFPYQARDDPCGGPYSHPFRALTWSYINIPYNDIPSPAAIKQAIYTYGPVAAAVCVGPAFGYYQDGIFSTDEKSFCGTSKVNHGIVLVGWDDSQEVWILRNSWGANWGESGYMRIRYGTSNVGFAANYLEYNPSSGSPTPSPTTPTPTAPPLASNLYLPLILRLTQNSVLLPNGNFEQGRTIWQEYSQNGYWLIYNINQTSNAAAPHSGVWAAWLGGVDDEISFIQQSVMVPADKPILGYWHWIASEDSCGYDFGGVLVNGIVIDVYDLCDEQNTQGWTLYTVDLSHYKGQTITLQIRAETDDLYNSNLFVDDVGFHASLTASLAPKLQAPQLFSAPKTESGMEFFPNTTPSLFDRVFHPSLTIRR